MPATLATDVNVPAVSKKSIKSNVKITVDIPAVIAADKSNSKRYVIGGGALAIPLKFASLLGYIFEKLPKPLLTRDQVKLMEFENISTLGLQNLKKIVPNPKSLEIVLPTYLK